MYSISTLLNDLTSVTHGTTVNKVPNIFGIINRAARAVLADVDPKETQRIVSLAQVFNEVFDYACPADVKGDRIVDLRLQAGRMPWDVFIQDYATNFDANKLVSFANKIYTQWNTGIKSLRIEAPLLTEPVTLCDTGTITGWAATTGASTISLDTQYAVAGSGALKFNLLAGSGSGYIQNSTLTAVNVSANENISTLFLWVYLPTATAVTAVDLRWGSSTTAYWNYTATTDFQGNAFVNGWNLLSFPWVSATVTGTPSSSAVNYLRTTFTYNSTLQTGVKIDNLTSNLGFIFELQYYSKYLFRNPNTNAFQETVTDEATDGNTIINLDTDSYNLLFNKCAFYVAQSLQGADAGYDADFWDSEYQESLTRYKGLNPSEAMLKRSVYYSLPNRSNYNRFGPFGPNRQ